MKTALLSFVTVLGLLVATAASAAPTFDHDSRRLSPKERARYEHDHRRAQERARWEAQHRHDQYDTRSQNHEHRY